MQEDTITKFKLPKQEVTSTECSFKEELGGDGIAHSHHNMEAFILPRMTQLLEIFTPIV